MFVSFNHVVIGCTEVNFCVPPIALLGTFYLIDN